MSIFLHCQVEWNRDIYVTHNMKLIFYIALPSNVSIQGTYSVFYSYTFQMGYLCPCINCLVPAYGHKQIPSTRKAVKQVKHVSGLELHQLIFISGIAARVLNFSALSFSIVEVFFDCKRYALNIFITCILVNDNSPWAVTLAEDWYSICLMTSLTT